MKHNDIYVKFMIEYDKANVTSSYPSLTEYEVATVLDKAYNALIAQKVTGNNVRRSTFESDVKAIADLAPLTTNENRTLVIAPEVASNVSCATKPEDMLYFLQANMAYKMTEVNTNKEDYHKYEDGNENEIIVSQDPTKPHPFDRVITRKLPVKLVNHEIAQKFFSSAFNMPWIKEPVCYLEEDKIYVVYDPLDIPLNTGSSYDNGQGTYRPGGLDVFYIKKPNLFVKDLNHIKNDLHCSTCSYFMYENPGTNYEEEVERLYTFECNDTVAEELISLAVAFALENVESARLNSKLNMRGLEA